MYAGIPLRPFILLYELQKLLKASVEPQQPNQGEGEIPPPVAEDWMPAILVITMAQCKSFRLCIGFINIF